NPRLRRARLRAARRSVRRARRWAFCYRNNLPQVLREAGLLAALDGRMERARRLVERSVAVAEQQGAAHEVLLSRIAVTELPSDRPAAEVARERSAATTELDALLPAGSGGDGSSLGGRGELSIHDRFTVLLDAARAITAAATPSALDDAVVAATARLLHAERAVIVPVGSALGASDSSVTAASRSLLQRAVDERRPVVELDAIGAGTNDSLVLSG